MKILVVDDEHDIRLFLKDLLTQAGHDVTTAASGRQALTYTTQRQFEMILLDVMMPAMDGCEVAEVLLNRWDTSETPIVIITSSKDQELQGWADRAGFSGFIRKPFSNQELLDTLARIEKRRAPGMGVQRQGPQDETLKLR